MTHAEAKELLLDHAYGELPPHVASDVAEHLTGCDECRAEQVSIASLRKSFAPLGDVEEPGEGFDARILAAARAEAQLTHDGNIGEVVEVTASEARPGIEPVSIDAHARALPAQGERRRPKWMKAGVAAASVAAVAALAVVVAMPSARKSPPTQEAYRIHVTPQMVPEVARGGDDAARQSALARPEQPARAENEEGPPEPAAAQRKAPPPAAHERSKVAINAGAQPAAPAPERVEPLAPSPRPAAEGGVASSPPPPPARVEPPPQAQRSAAAQTQSALPTPLPASREMPAANAAARSDAQAAAEVAPAELERRAGAARRSGNYPLAAALYRQAAHARTDDASSAAWDLAHAVECLSAAGSFDDARAARDELKQRYPAESGAFSAARRALREVDQGQ